MRGCLRWSPSPCCCWRSSVARFWRETRKRASGCELSAPIVALIANRVCLMPCCICSNTFQTCGTIWSQKLNSTWTYLYKMCPDSRAKRMIFLVGNDTPIRSCGSALFLLLLLISLSQFTRPFVQPGANRFEKFRPPARLPLTPYLVVSVDVSSYGALVLMLFDSV
jgi:hypothetical protein